MDQIEMTARIIFDAMESSDWDALSEGKKKEWLAKAKEVHDAVGTNYWPTHLTGGTIH